MGILTYFCIYLSVQEQKFGVQVLWDASFWRGSLIGLFTSFSVFMFKLRFEFVRSDAWGCEGELGSVLLSVRRGSLRAHRTRRASTQFSFSVLVFECFKLFWMFKLARLKKPVNDKLSWRRAATVLIVFFLALASRLRSPGAPAQPWAPIIVTTFHPTSDGPALSNKTLREQALL